jgi:Ca2+-binding EF-hand superfamily protein
MAQHLTEDEASLMRGEPSSHVANYVGEYLADADGKPNKAAELVMTRMISIFDSVDQDRSGALSKAEIYMIFKEIGFDSPDAVDACLDPMLALIEMPDTPRATTAAKSDAAAGASTDSARGGLFGCAPSKDSGGADSLSKESKKHKRWDPMTKPVFLAWFLSVEKQARQLTAEHVAEIWFSLIDDDGSERLSVMELQEVLESCGKGFSPNDMTQLILELDHNGDGEFDKHEFTMWIEKHNPDA